jgi:hypothetical protein
LIFILIARCAASLSESSGHCQVRSNPGKGTLEVRGLDADNHEVSRHAIQTSAQPYALGLQSVWKENDADGLIQLVLQVVDEKGIPVMLSDNEVSCHIDGPARLLGLEASNNADMSDYTDNVHRVFHGRILAYIQPTGQEGEIKVRFTSPWLKPAEAVVR